MKMKHLFNKVLFISFIFIGIRCGNNQSIGKKSPQEKGYIMGTITIIDENPKFSSYLVNYKPINAKRNWYNSYNRIIINPKAAGLKQALPSDYNIDNKHRFIFFRKLEIGEYDFFNFEFFENLGMTQYSIVSKADFSIPFKVKSDSITYVGDIQLPSGKNKQEQQLIISDHLSLDSARFCEKYRGINWSLIQNSTAKK